MNDERGDVAGDTADVGGLAHEGARVGVLCVPDSELGSVADHLVLARRVQPERLLVLQPVNLQKPPQSKAHTGITL